MTLLKIYRFFCLALVLVLSVWASAFAQGIPVVLEGKVSNLAVLQEPGTSYFWKIFIDQTLTTEAPATNAEFVSGNQGAVVSVLWKTRGIYFFSVTAFGPTGCMNLKIGMLKVIPIEIEAVIAGITQTGACEQVTLDASKSIGDLIKYEWTMIDKGGALTRQTGLTTEFLLSSDFTASLPADFRVKLKVTNRTGDTSNDTITIKVDRLPVADIFSTGKLEKDGTMIVDGTISTGTALNYRWFSSTGKIVGPNNEPTVKLIAPGIYSLEITDNHGCKSVKSFKFPLEIHQIMANPDYARTSWSLDTTIRVLDNDISTVKLIPGSVHVTQQPARGGTKVNADGTIIYSPTERHSGRDQFVYEVCDEVNLCASATVTIDIYDSGLTIPEGFSPNGDGVNDHLVFRGLENYLKSQLYVFTRSGQLVYGSVDYLNDWGGTTIKSTLTELQLVPTGVYYYVLKLGGTNRSVKGFVYIGY